MTLAVPPPFSLSFFNLTFMKNIFSTIALMSIALAISAQNRYYVNAQATGANNGQNWANAFSALQAAMQAAQAGDEIWVAQGIYKL